ncbi:MAG: hypothetical protein II956_13590 [Bacteroidales bacterium]|nr:hypothetical protein [Bacteroidales bacterium]
MKNILLIILACLSLSVSAQTSDSIRIKNLETDFANLSNRVNDLQKIQNQQNQTIAIQNAKIEALEQQLGIKATELETSLNEKSSALESTITTKIGETDSKISQTAESLNQSISANKLIAIIGIIVAVILLVVVYLVLKNKIGSKDSDIDKIKSAQKSLENVQKSMQEESVKLDNKLIELLEKQMTSQPIVTESKSSEPDHSLALKVADEIIRIETNLSKMDSSVKGYKQLSKAVERIRANFMANGYEIVDMLNKPYNEGMKVTANFVSDESLADGEQKITGITKPQINYNGKMIQSAQITVSQNI